MLVTTFAPTGGLIIGIEDTIERRRGRRSRLKESIATNGKDRSWITPHAAADATSRINFQKRR
jgi:hypothetical protein